MSRDHDPSGISGETRRLLVLAVFILGALLALHFTPLKAWMEDIRSLKARIDDYGLLADAAFVAISMAAIALGVPRLALCGLAGTLFGFVEGALVALIASVLGSYGAFLLARWGGRAWAERKLAGATERLQGTLAEPTIANIFIARQLPVPGIVPNVLLGLMPTPHRTFLIGTFLGYLPSNAIVALAGSSLGKESLTKAIMQVSLSMMGLALLSILLVWLTGRRR
ncbi:MAG: VTT domain-containing protein [Hyphomicrobiaceae bacterium]